jgi:hypothetical protein
MSSGGFLLGGRLVPVPGAHVIAPGQFSWAVLGPDDYRPRHTRWVRQVIIHTTKGIWPQYVRKSAGPPGMGKAVADFWRKDPQHSGAHFVIDRNGDIINLVDVLTMCAYHATTSNDWSVGIEMYQEGDGGIYEAVLESTVALVAALCDALAIPKQISSDPYTPGQIIERLKNGGPDCVGIFGHRSQSWKFPFQLDAATKKRYPQGYAGRGRGDPGDLIFDYITRELNPERFQYEAEEDLDAWGVRQDKLNKQYGERLQVDGVAGPGTIAAMRRHGFEDGRALDAA